jgi:hypothetical protein
MSNATRGFYEYHPPRPSGTGAYDSVTTAVTADRTSLWANLGTPEGKVWLEFQNNDATDSIYFNLTTTDSGAGATTALTGYKLTPGSVVSFFINPTNDVYVDWKASANTPVLKWRVTSPPYDRINQ